MNITETILDGLLDVEISIKANVKDIVVVLQDLYLEIYEKKIFLSNELDIDILELMVVKYGMLDMTFNLEVKEEYNIVRFMLFTTGAGPKFFEAHPKINIEFFFSNYKNSFKKLMPLHFIIKDACLTNNMNVWSEKYFYL